MKPFRIPQQAFYAAFIAVLLLLPAAGLFVTFMTAREQAKESRAMSFVLPDLYNPGEMIRYPPADRAAVVNIFASWCPPCKAEHPLLLELKEKYDVPLYGIAWNDKPEDTRKWLEEMGNPYVSVSSDLKNLTAQTLGATGVPETIVLDPQGNILYRHRGPLDANTVRFMIAPILASR